MPPQCTPTPSSELSPGTAICMFPTRPGALSPSVSPYRPPSPSCSARAALHTRLCLSCPRPPLTLGSRRFCPSPAHPQQHPPFISRCLGLLLSKRHPAPLTFSAAAALVPDSPSTATPGSTTAAAPPATLVAEPLLTERLLQSSPRPQLKPIRNRRPWPAASSGTAGAAGVPQLLRAPW